MEKRLVYPAIVKEYNDEDGHYFVATSPNIKGMVTQGDSLGDVVYHSEDAIATMISDYKDYPEPQDPKSWSLDKDERVVFVSVNMDQWLKKYGKTVRRNISIPEYLNDWAKDNNVNVSRITTDALKKIKDA
ncbi:antitoxin HicB [Paucilactobacillus hokkaidonensis JCM 18461]|uniref:Antitoxin HicB n=2 Tax=Paucilactobacillus hokkaidonensis TaxID=1193095 RepID=A0A0A1GSI8_9LACO|nr:type II toxin-antitoxin system HicB family antitoxin [Paucilactobacillus hokkaidonensis]KRO09536.1 putative phage protein [Paucilactobacillus hokkaidonensis]BAP85242.1 antitoxin HicB [Paucilactobacillus hokkaidonensis JCM 18461]